jgi:hypothetical protein
VHRDAARRVGRTLPEHGPRLQGTPNAQRTHVKFMAGQTKKKANELEQGEQLPHKGVGVEGALLGVEAEHLDRGAGPRSAVHGEHARRPLLLPAPDPRRARHLPAARRRRRLTAIVRHGRRWWWLSSASGFSKFSGGVLKRSSASGLRSGGGERTEQGKGRRVANDDQISWCFGGIARGPHRIFLWLFAVFLLVNVKRFCCHCFVSPAKLLGLMIRDN